MKAAEATGKTVEEAVSSALDQLGAARESVDVEVLQEPRPALLGFGGREARVRVVVREAGPDSGLRDAAALATQVVHEILGRMGLQVAVTVRSTEEQVIVDLSGGDVAGVIGRRGQTLDAIELLVVMQLSRQFGRKVPLTIDAEGYRARRANQLREHARHAADRAVREKRAIFLDPMPARERRIIHLALQVDARVTTSSIGEGDERRVVIHLAEGSQGPLPAGLPSDIDEEE